MEKMEREHIAEIIDAIDAKSVDGDAIEAAASKAAKKLYLKRIHKHGNRVVVIGLCLALIIAGGTIWHAKYSLSAAYAITAGDEDICYVRNKSAADKVINELVAQYTPEDADVKAVGNGNLKTAPADQDKVKEAGTIKVDEAVEVVDKALKESEDKDDGIKVISSQVVEETFTPEVVYEKDDSMFAGETVIKTEGKDGKKRVTKLVTTLNGSVAGEDILETEMLDEGTSEVIVKGTLGLPTDADWKTYEGAPVFNNADDLITTCKKYIGAPYKYGGKSLTTGIDCVQFVRQMFAKYGISIPNRHSDIHKVGISVSKNNIQKGDIICYKGHVAIYIGNGKVIDATPSRGVGITNAHLNKNLITIRRIPHN